MNIRLYRAMHPQPERPSLGWMFMGLAIVAVCLIVWWLAVLVFNLEVFEP